MALSGKTLEIDTLTTQLLYNRGVSLFSSVTYFPTYSTLSNGAYASWALYPLSSIFYSTFYGYSNFDWFNTSIKTICTNNINVSTTLGTMYSDVAYYSTSTAAVLATFSNLPVSTISSLQIDANLYVNYANSNVSTLVKFSTLDYPGLAYWTSIDPPVFMSTNFDPNSNTIINIAQSNYGYIQIIPNPYVTLAAAIDTNAGFGSGITNSTIFTTSNGTSWSEVQSPPTFYGATTIAYNGSYFLAGGISTSGPDTAFAVSYNGQTWSTYTGSTNANPPLAFPLSLAWNGSVWVMGTSGGVLNENLFFSYDAIYWSTIAYPGSVPSGYIPPQKLQAVYSVAWNGNTFCATGQPASGNQHPILISENGFDWYGTPVGPNFNFTTGYKSYPYKNGWLVGGTASGMAPESVLLHLSTNQDGGGNKYISWYSILLKATTPTFPMKVTAIAEHDGLLVIGMESGPPSICSLAYTNQIRQDADFTAIDLNNAWFSNVNDIHYTGQTWLAGGYPGDSDRSNTFAYSDDGITWIPDGHSTFSTAVFQFISYNSDPNANSTGPKRVYTGVSSIMSTLSYPPFSTNVATNYPAILSNTSVSWTYYESTTRGTLSSLNYRIQTEAPYLIDSGSTLSTIYVSTTMQLQSSINNQFFGSYVSTFSTTIVRDYFANFQVADLTSSLVTASNLMQRQQVIYIDQMYATYSNNGARQAIATFSNIASTQFIAASNDFSQYNGLPGLEILIRQNNTILIPFLDLISVSTNQTSLVNLSTFAVSSLSSFSSLFPFILASSLFYDLRFLNSNISSLSTQGPVQTSSFLALHDRFITGPGVSSIQFTLSTGISTSFVNYSQILSAPQTTFSNAYINVNMVPGLCTLAASTLECFSTINISSPEVLNFLYSQFPISSQYANSFLSTTLSTINSNLSSYVSSVAVYSTLSTYARLYSTQGELLSQYVSSQNAPGGAFDITLSSILQIPANTLQIINPFIGSTTFFTLLDGLSSYILSNNGTLARSTFFTQIRTSSIIGDPNLNATTLGIQIPQRDSYSLSLQGNLKVVETTGGGGGGGGSVPSVYSFVMGHNSNAYNLTYSNGTQYIRYLYATPNLSGSPGYDYLSSMRFGADIYNGELLIPSRYERLNPMPPSPPPSQLDYLLNRIVLSNNYIPDPLISSVNVFFSSFYNYQDFSPSEQFDTTNTLQFVTADNWFFFSQFSNTAPIKNTIIYGEDIGNRQTINRSYTWPQIFDPVLPTIYRTMGPLTSLTTNGNVYLFTATDRSFSSNFGFNPSLNWDASITPAQSVYTMVVTSNINLSTANASQISTLLQLDTGFIPSIYDSLWTGTSWIVAGNGVFRSADGLAWSQVLPSNAEPYLGYRSLDTDGTTIFLAEVSTAPIYIELKKSTDDGQTWSYVYSFEMTESQYNYADVGISTSIYTPTIRWAYNSWNLAIAPLNRPDIPFKKAFHYQSANEGLTWSAQDITTTGLSDFPSGAPSGDFTTGKFPFVAAEIPAPPDTTIYPTLQLPGFQIYANETYNSNPPSMAFQIYTSSIHFMSSISLLKVPNSIQRGLLGLNIAPTEYALDLGFGDARKPAGALWISPSDRRIKHLQENPNLTTLTSQLEHLRLISFQYTNEYSKIHGVSSEPQLGFLSQEVKQIFSSSVLIDRRFGLSDFESLDMDQIYMAKFAVTRDLIGRVSSLKARIQAMLN